MKLPKELQKKKEFMDNVSKELSIVKDYELTKLKIGEVSEPCRKCPLWLEQEKLWEESDNVANSRKFYELMVEIEKLDREKCDHCEIGKQIFKLREKELKLKTKISDMGWKKFTVRNR